MAASVVPATYLIVWTWGTSSGRAHGRSRRSPRRGDVPHHVGHGFIADFQLTTNTKFLRDGPADEALLVQVEDVERLIQGGKMISGVSSTSSVEGEYWISW